MSKSHQVEAKLRYLPNDLQVINRGDYVLCAVSGKPIDLDALRYWNVERQEAYSGPKEALERYLMLREQER